MGKFAALTTVQVLQGIGAVVSAVGAISQGVSAGRSAELQAQILRREAERERALSRIEAGEFGRGARRLLARQRALTGASGAQIGAGTPLALAEDTAAEAEFQRLKILAGGEATAERLLSQAMLAGFQGRAARSRGFFRGGSILLRGAGEVFGRTGERAPRKPRR